MMLKQSNRYSRDFVFKLKINIKNLHFTHKNTENVVQITELPESSQLFEFINDLEIFKSHDCIEIGYDGRLKNIRKEMEVLLTSKDEFMDNFVNELARKYILE